MAMLDPLKTAEHITTSYRRYLRTTFGLADPLWHAEFEQALGSADLTKGPILEATPPYETAGSVESLISEGTLHTALRRLPTEVLHRPLYTHQVDAIRKAAARRNLIVATGTGSGKTECYLLPIFDALLQEQERGALCPGVRALLLYPMNALANDQLDRLRSYLKAFPGITFGRFIGETEEKESKARETFRQLHDGAEPLANELLSRERMRAQPPHILLTNYAMLEYLLLRPEDTPFFDGETGRFWRFIVLDELHVYDGAKGAEIAMLLRRVRDRVHQSEKGRLQYLATSATLGRGEEDRHAVVTFARQVFDEELDDTDIVLPKRRAFSGQATHEFSAAQFLDVRDRVAAGESVEALSQRLPFSGFSEQSGEPVSRWLERILRGERHVIALQRLLSERPVELAEAARDIFGADDAKALTAVVELSLQARESSGSTPLLPARYHFLVKALEGAFACLNPNHPANSPRLQLGRQAICEACNARMFELAVCRRCRALYVVGTRTDDERFVQAKEHDRKLHYLWVLAHGIPGDAISKDEDELAIEADVPEETPSQLKLCTTCGWIGHATASHGSCTGICLPVVSIEAKHEDGTVHSCVACGGRSGAPMLLRMFTGTDAPVAVVATAVYQQLPPSGSENQQDRIGEGRKLLSFADSRQDAAFFAPYLERTYRRAIQRRLIWEALKELPAARPKDLVQRVVSLATKHRVIDPDQLGVTGTADEVLHWIFGEILATDRRQSLEGVGLVECAVAIPRNAYHIPPALLKLGFTNDEALDLVRVLLDSVRASAAVWLPKEINMSSEVFWPRNNTTSIRKTGHDKGILAWLPSQNRGFNRRFDYLQKVFAKRGIQADPHEVLDGIWDWLTHPQGPWAETLEGQRIGSQGMVFALNSDRIEFVPLSPGHRPYRCTACGQVWWRSISDVCPSFRCPGILKPFDPENADDHYRVLYTGLTPIGMVVQEHTAQLTSETATRYQKDFQRGAINVLSCSTTFELGVDVGEVEAVLMRNVPPSPANYVQRAGRAGRRIGRTAMVITFAQRRNHDLWFFNNWKHLVSGHVRPPVTKIANPHIVRRHLHSVAFAMWEKLHYEQGGQPHRTIADFFLPEEDAAYEQFVAWLHNHPQALQAALVRVTPPEVLDELGVQTWRWVDDLLDQESQTGVGWLARAATEVRSEHRELEKAYNEAIVNRNPARAIAIERVLHTVDRRRLIDFLAQRVVLPKYGFPVDVVTLDVVEPGKKEVAQVELERDLRLAILDFAPGNVTVANKTMWEAKGLRVPPGKSLIRRRWGICKHCETITVSKPFEIEDHWTCKHCGSHESLANQTNVFVVPEFGFLGGVSKQQLGEARPPRYGSIAKHFSEYQGTPPEPRLIQLSSGMELTILHSKQAQITFVNRGRGGFRLCAECGYLEEAPDGTKRGKRNDRPNEHVRPTPVNKACRGKLSFIHLGHQILTDAVEIQLPRSIVQRGEEQSVLAALLSAMPAIGIGQGNVSGVVYPLSDGSGFVLFDAVPGGAGYAEGLADPRLLNDLLRAARDRVATCECGLDSSCYSCLRMYENQAYHDELVRGKALRVLNQLLGLPGTA